jgi:hypothetical protein
MPDLASRTKDFAAVLDGLDAIEGKKVPAPVEEVADGEAFWRDHERRAAENLRQWKASGAPLAWVEGMKGRWTDADWESLVAALRVGASWPMKEEEIRQALEQARAAWQARQSPAPEKRKAGDILTVAIAPPPVPKPPNGERFVTVSWQAAK